MRRAVLAAISSLGLFVAYEANPNELLTFSASCTDVQVETYRYDRDIQGNLMENGWFPGDRFKQVWTFEYSGNRELRVDGKPIPILAEAGPVLLAGVPATNPFAASMWVYVIHRDLKVISAAQVNGYSGTGRNAGVKARSVELNCVFKSA